MNTNSKQNSDSAQGSIGTTNATWSPKVGVAPSPSPSTAPASAGGSSQGSSRGPQG